jgi:metal-responsive CopG/Arc/MetJ family transcriptional regulator
MNSIKTAISVPKDLFELSERLAKKLKVSRSKIFAMGVKKLAEEHDDDEITMRLNEFYSKEKAEIDPVIMKMAALSLPENEW